MKNEKINYECRLTDYLTLKSDKIRFVCKRIDIQLNRNVFLNIVKHMNKLINKIK